MLVTLSFPVMQLLASAYLDCYLARRSLSVTVKLNGVNPRAWLKAIVDWSWSTPGSVRGQWKKSADVESRATLLFLTPLLPRRRSPAGSPW